MRLGALPGDLPDASACQLETAREYEYSIKNAFKAELAPGEGVRVAGCTRVWNFEAYIVNKLYFPAYLRYMPLIPAAARRLSGALVSVERSVLLCAEVSHIDIQFPSPGSCLKPRILQIYTRYILPLDPARVWTLPPGPPGHPEGGPGGRVCPGRVRALC